jgi:putative addiction module component (TIGR02574 family)
MSVARKIIEDALTLPPEDRARVAAALIESLDADEDPDAERAWATEIERRVERVLAGESQGAPWEEVRERLMARLDRR